MEFLIGVVVGLAAAWAVAKFKPEWLKFVGINVTPVTTA